MSPVFCAALQLPSLCLLDRCFGLVNWSGASNSCTVHKHQGFKSQTNPFPTKSEVLESREVGGSWRPPGCASHAPRISRSFPAWRPGSRACEAPARCRPKAPRPRLPTGNRGPVLGIPLLRRQPSRLSHKAGGCPMKIGGVPLLRRQPNWGRLPKSSWRAFAP